MNDMMSECFKNIIVQKIVENRNSGISPYNIRIC